jgi:hypothetical protein
MKTLELETIEKKTDVELFTGDYLDKQTALGRQLLKSFMPDVSTQKGRDAIKTFSVQYRTVKVRVDEAGKNLGSDLRDKLSKINSSRNSFKVDWQEMQDDARKPLTDWEAAEEAKEEAERQKVIDELDRIERERVAAIEKREADLAAKELAMELAEEQRIAKEAFAASEKERVEREAEVKRKAEEQAEINLRAAVAEEKRQAEEAIATAKREKQEAIDKAERDRLQAIELAERQKIEAVKAQERQRIAAEQETERQVQAERDRIAAEELAEDQAAQKRYEDKKHMANINYAALAAFAKVGLDKKSSKMAVEAIAKHLIPHVSIRY